MPHSSSDLPAAISVSLLRVLSRYRPLNRLAGRSDCSWAGFSNLKWLSLRTFFHRYLLSLQGLNPRNGHSSSSLSVCRLSLISQVQRSWSNALRTTCSRITPCYDCFIFLSFFLSLFFLLFQSHELVSRASGIDMVLRNDLVNVANFRARSPVMRLFTQGSMRQMAIRWILI